MRGGTALLPTDRRTNPGLFLRSRTSRARLRRTVILIVLASAVLLVWRRNRPTSDTNALGDSSPLPDLAHPAPADPFADLVFHDEYGELHYPAQPRNTTEEDSSFPSDFTSAIPQPHPIHYLMREAERTWNEKLARQSRTLPQAVAEYRRRYGRPPPRHFDQWFRFARQHKVQLVDEYDSLHRRILPYAALRPEVLQARSEELQHPKKGASSAWLAHDTVTIRVQDHQISTHGAQKDWDRIVDLTNIMKRFVEFIPDLNMTMTIHDSAFLTIGAENRERHEQAALAGTYLDDIATHSDKPELDGFAVVCPPNSPMRQVDHYDFRPPYVPLNKSSFIGLDHVKAMDLCYHPEYQPIHGAISNGGPRPGVLYPFFTWSTTSLHSELLLPPLEQYNWSVGPDPVWHDKQYDKVVWRGGTTGADMSSEYGRKYTQRVRLARLPFSQGRTTVPLAADDSPSLLGPVKDFLVSAAHLASSFLDIKFDSSPTQCGDGQACEDFENEFEWAEFMMPEENNQYKYLIDVDGNGWSGRFHRLMSTNSLVLKSTLFPEWYSDRIQPWLHYLPVKLDYSDLFPILAFFRGSPFKDRQGAHDALAETIATAGKKWAGEFWRVEDMQAYLFRLLLEYNRVMQGHGTDYVE
ncbi:hypothetical protein JCM8097_005532 [Rhodosporidiobolus ruineniae]